MPQPWLYCHHLIPQEHLHCHIPDILVEFSGFSASFLPSPSLSKSPGECVTSASLPLALILSDLIELSLGHGCPSQ